MFELRIAGKYLLPQKKHLSRSLIALLSVGVITLVVWLVLLFLSINEGIQKRWIGHITKLNAPLQITPTDAYYHSYYYQIDEYASASDFTKKTLREKRESLATDPFDPAMDPELPISFPQPVKTPEGALRDFAKEVHTLLESIPTLSANEYEVAAGVLKLKLITYDPMQPARVHPSKTLLSQAVYLKSFCGKEGTQEDLLIPPMTEDLEKLIGCIERLGLYPTLAKRLFANVSSLEFTTAPDTWRLPTNLLPEGVSIPVSLTEKGGRIQCILGGTANCSLKKEGHHIHYTRQTGETGTLPASTHFSCADPLILHVDSVNTTHASTLDTTPFHVHTTYRGIPLQGVIGWREVTLSKCDPRMVFEEIPEHEPLWPYCVGKERATSLPSIPGYTAVVIPKNLRENGTRIGDTGHVTFAATTATSVLEQERPLFVSGFYDPGAINVGIRFVLAPPETVTEINGSSSNIPIDRGLLNGIQVWHSEKAATQAVYTHITKALEERGLSPYFTVTPYYQYPQVRELIQQFQSDQYLFTLVAVLILIVACSNIITLSVLLVNDKKKEIGILRSMGATTKSIALIFGLTGALTGILSTGLGVVLAYLTLLNIDTLIGILSAFQGHDVFAESFFGAHLPSALSSSALLFVGITTPLIALGAGLVSAVKACRLKTASILRGDG